MSKAATKLRAGLKEAIAVAKRSKRFRFWSIMPDGGDVGGVLTRKPRMRKQDKRFIAEEYFAVVFFPKITGIPKATFCMTRGQDTLSRTPEAAIVKFMDGIAKGEKWETYHKAGHRVRKVRVIDLGDATPKQKRK